MKTKKIEIEKIEEIEKDDYNIIELEELDEDEKRIIKPLVPPTSGLRMEIFKEDKDSDQLIMPRKFQYRFLRVLKAIAVIGKREILNGSTKNEDKPLSILIVTDDRYSADLLLDYASRIFAYEGYNIYYQTGEGEKLEGSDYVRGKSKMGTPYASASIVLYDNIDLVLMITASHNSSIWNGLKFYIKRPIPITGGVMNAVSDYALSLKEIRLAKSITPLYIDADKKNNEYILNLVKKIIDINVLKDKKIIIWPLLGGAPEIITLLRNCGARVKIINKSMDPPDPTKPFDKSEVIKIMKKEDAKISIILDADRDRIVFITKLNGDYLTLSPNELYTAMHNILIQEFNKKLINIRTVPSDPRCDKNADLNIITGVGYKHLGILMYLLMGLPVPQSQLEMGIFYHYDGGKFNKIHNREELLNILKSKSLKGEYICALWEESGGHTFNIINIDENYNISSDMPIIGDKYPAPAIVILSALLEEGYNFLKYIDVSIKSSRVTIHANDEQKIGYINYFEKILGKSIDIGNYKYQIGNFSDMNGKTKIIYLKSESSTLYIRPSGTGPNIRIYIFGASESYEEELNAVKKYVENIDI